MLSLIPSPQLSTQHIALLRTLCSCSIAEISQAAATGTSVRDFTAFGSAWEEDRLLLRKISLLYVAPAPGFVIKEVADDGAQETLSPQGLQNQLALWRSIELEQQRQSDLEMGYIESEEQFEPHDEDWTLP